MFTLIVGGPIDPTAAGAALAIMFATLCIFCTAFILKRRSRREIANDFELAKMKERDSSALLENNNARQHEMELKKIDSNRAIEFKRIESSVGMLDVSPQAAE